MRCARCDQPVVPQAVGWTLEGRIVFGWCLHCLTDNECLEVEIATPRRRTTTQLVLRERRKRSWLESGPGSRGRRATPHNLPSPARQLLRGAGAIIGIWGGILLISGLVLSSRPSEMVLTAVERSIPHVMIAGGGTIAIAGALLWTIATHFWNRSQRWLRGTQAFFFGAALLTLGLGVATHEPRRDPWIVAAATVALIISALARWVEVRTPKIAAAHNRGGSAATKSKAR